jgi:hypothetical protein
MATIFYRLQVPAPSCDLPSRANVQKRQLLTRIEGCQNGLSGTKNGLPISGWVFNQTPLVLVLNTITEAELEILLCNASHSLVYYLPLSPSIFLTLLRLLS